jgi:hypothetical protein
MAERVLTLGAIILMTTVSAWVTAYRMRRRMKKALGRKPVGAELTSISTWMQVGEAEQRKPLG